MAAGANQLLSTSESSKCENCCSLNAREECLPSASVEGWLPPKIVLSHLLPTWLAQVMGQPIGIQTGQDAWEAVANAEKVTKETREACFLTFTPYFSGQDSSASP